MCKKTRIPAHHVGELAEAYTKSALLGYTKKIVYSDHISRDYGYDAMFELFPHGRPSGKFVLLQIKGTEKTITSLKKSPFIPCTITTASALYALQDTVPFYLFFLCVHKPDAIYFTDLRDAVKKVSNYEYKINNQDNVRVHIPQENILATDPSMFFNMVMSFYDISDFSLN